MFHSLMCQSAAYGARNLEAGASGFGSCRRCFSCIKNTPRASELTNFLAACATFNIRIFFSSLRAMSWSRMLPKGASSFATHIIQPYPSSPHLGLPLAGHVSTALLHTTHAMMHHALRWLTALRRWCSLNKIVGTCSGWFSVTSR